MTGIPAKRSPLAGLVIFMIGLSIAASLVAGIHYAAIDLPQQQTPQAPANEDCFLSCENAYNQCVAYCNTHGCTNSQRFMCWRTRDNCENDCF